MPLAHSRCYRVPIIVALVALTTAVCGADAARPRLILIGDSTVKNGSGKGEGGLYGWGQVIAEYFDTSQIDVDNRALGGRSSRTYLTEGLWQDSLNRLRPGDFVLMQFGHNDGGQIFKGNRPRASIKGNGDESELGVVEMTGKHETVHSYGWYLRKYIADIQDAGATPIVLSLVPRNRWQDGKVIRSSDDYAQWAREAAQAGGAEFIDLNELVARRYEALGRETVARELFTKTDWTHTTLAGAKVNAACVVDGIRQLKNCPLAKYLLPPQEQQPDQTTWRFEFDSQEVIPGYQDVHSHTPYSREIGFGYEPIGDPANGPFYFSVAVPPGNYRVKVTRCGGSPLTIKAELRRLMVQNWICESSADETREFTVNVRTPELSDSRQVSLKPREKQSEAWAWDEKLTLEFLGEQPHISWLEVAPEPTATTVFLAGDSTVCDQPLEPWNSWGQMLPRFFKSGVVIANHAESGESLRSSLGAGRFEKIFSLVKPGDYLFMQFGHNDMKDKSPNALETYRANLEKVVQKTRSLGARPVLVTSMERKPGPHYLSLGDYPETVRSVARELQVPLIDLNGMSQKLYTALGGDLDRAFQDGTHHTNYGSYLFAKCVLQGIIDNDLDLKESIVDEFDGFDPQHPDPWNSFSVPASSRQDTTAPWGS